MKNGERAANKGQIAALIAMIIIGTYTFLPEIMVTAGSNGESPDIVNGASSAETSGGEDAGNEYGNGTVSGSENGLVNEAGTVSGNEGSLGYKAGTASENELNASLQIPQKVTIIINPWEIGGKGQVYSEKYVMCNLGETTGILTLTNYVEASAEQNEIIVRTDRNGLHQGQGKMIYLEMVLGNGERVTFTEEGSAYEISLEPGEELAFWFDGGVNENASCLWRSGDVSLRMEYTWNTMK